MSKQNVESLVQVEWDIKGWPDIRISSFSDATVKLTFLLLVWFNEKNCQWKYVTLIVYVEDISVCSGFSATLMCFV